MALLSRQRWNAWVNGESYGSGNPVFDVEEPATGHLLAQVARLQEEDVSRAVGVARNAFDDERWSELSGMTRGKVLLKLAQEIRNNLDEIAHWETRQVGKPISDSRDEVMTAADCVRTCR